MTRVIYRDRQDRQELILSGHAERADPEGANVVCAGISAICQTLWENLQREEESGQIRAEGKMDTPGEMTLTAWTTPENRDAIRNMYQFTINGLEAIQRSYPGNLIIEEERGHGII